jgi:uncharacterized protein (TIGR00297 family)
VAEARLTWQSKLVLLAVLPFAGTQVTLACIWLSPHTASEVAWTIGLSTMLGLITWRLRAATPFAALTGALITASLMFSTVTAPDAPWNSALLPIVAVFLLAFAATRAGRAKKERLGTAEKRRGRSASQVAANLGVAALAASIPLQVWLVNAGLVRSTLTPPPVLPLALAALAEAAADTVSSEIGQVLGGRPRLIISLKAVDPGRDGAVSLAGTLAGLVAAAIVAGTGTWALRGDWILFAVSTAGGVFGLFFDSLLGATFEEHGWLNNDAVNFLSTVSAAAFALLLLAFIPHPGAG